MGIGERTLSVAPAAWMTALVLIGVAAAPSRALGQGRSVSLSAGYQYLSVEDGHSNGIYADLSIGLAGPFSAVGAVDWSRDRSQAFGFAQTLDMSSVGGGGRWTLGSGRFSAFGQVLLGVERDTLTVERFGSETSSHLLVQPGGGIAVRFAGRLGVIGQLDWRHVRRREYPDALRAVVGAQLRLR
jgi:hypothetical protein